MNDSIRVWFYKIVDLGQTVKEKSGPTKQLTQ